MDLPLGALSDGVLGADRADARHVVDENAVQRLDGAPIGWRTAALRTIGTGLAVLPFFLGFLPVLLTKKRRGLNDLFAGTVVVYRVFQRDAAMHSGWIEASGHG